MNTSDPTRPAETRADGDLRRAVAAALCLTLAAGVLSVMIQGFRFPDQNNLFHVSIVLDYPGSADFAADPFHQSFRRFVSQFWRLMALVVDESTVGGWFLGAQLAIRCAILAALAALAWEFAGPDLATRRQAAACALIVGFMPAYLRVSPLGANEVLVSALTHSSAAIPAALAAMWLAIRGRFLAAAAAAGATANLNLFVAVWTGAAIGVAMLADRLSHGAADAARRAAAAREALAMAGLFALLAAPTAVWAVWAIAEATGAPAAEFDFLAFMRAYYPDHSFADWRDVAAAAVAIAAAALLLRRLPLDASRPQTRRATALAAALIATLAFGVALPSLSGERLLNNLYPLRMDAYLMLLFVAPLAAGAALLWSRGRGRGGAPDAAALAPLGVLATCFPLPAAAALVTTRRDRLLLAALIAATGAAHVGFGGAPLLWREPGAFTAVAALAQGALTLAGLAWSGAPPARIALAGALCAAATTPAPEAAPAEAAGALACVATGWILAAAAAWPAREGAPEGGGDARRAALGFGALALFGAAAVIAAATGGGGDATWAAPGAVAAIGAGAALARPAARVARGAGFRLRWAPGLGAAAVVVAAVAASAHRGALFDEPADRMLGGSTPAQLWARDHTPTGALFLPFGLHSFSTLSRRPVWVDWKLGAVALWAPELHGLWAERSAAVDAVDSVEDATALARLNHVDFIVASRRLEAFDAAALPMIVYEDAHVVIAATPCQTPCEAIPK